MQLVRRSKRLCFGPLTAQPRQQLLHHLLLALPVGRVGARVPQLPPQVATAQIQGVAATRERLQKRKLADVVGGSVGYGVGNVWVLLCTMAAAAAVRAAVVVQGAP